MSHNDKERIERALQIMREVLYGKYASIFSYTAVRGDLISIEKILIEVLESQKNE